jgi:uncharacterized protein (DUF58 family)
MTAASSTAANSTMPRGVAALRLAWRRLFARWVARRIPAARSVVLGHHNIFILPTRQGLGFLLVLGLMFIGAVNYEISLAFALVFLLLAMFLLSIFYTFRNLSGLHVSAVTGHSVFAGEKAEITIILNRYGERSYESVQACFPGSRMVVADLLNEHEQRVNLYIPAGKRGYFRPERLVLDTVFPFGICRAWSLIDLDLQCLVYPRPVACDMDWVLQQQSQDGTTTHARGADDFHGLRGYRQGDSLRHVAWKQFARGQGMYTKEYSSNMDERIWLRWSLFPQLSVEQRLSRLCWCVIQLDAAGVDYGLELPGAQLMPAKGQQHYLQALETLALFQLAGKAGR